MGTGLPLALAALSCRSVMISVSSSSSASSSSDGTENATCFLGLGREPRPAVAFFFSNDGPAEELAETPEAIEMPVVLWHEARCIGAEDFVGIAEVFGGAGAV